MLSLNTFVANGVLDCGAEGSLQIFGRFGSFGSVYGKWNAFAPNVFGFVVVAKGQSAKFDGGEGTGDESLVKC